MALTKSELIERIVAKRLKIHAPQVLQGRGANPRRHGVLAARMDQAVERHRAGQKDRPLGEPLAAEDVLQTQPFPELIAYMHRPRLSRTLHFDAVGVDGDAAPANIAAHATTSPSSTAAIVACWSSRAATARTGCTTW